MFQGFELLSDRLQQLFMATLAAGEKLHYYDEGKAHACSLLNCEMMHTDNSDVFICKTTGRVHECGTLCSLTPIAAQGTNSLVCPLSGLVRTSMAKLVATGAYTSEHDNTAAAGKNVRKRKMPDSAWAERYEKTNEPANLRVYWIGQRSIDGKRAPSLITPEGQREIEVAVRTVVRVLYESEESHRICQRASDTQWDVKTKELSLSRFSTNAQYARLLCIHAESFHEFHKHLDSVVLCLVVLYTWMTGSGVNRPPTAVSKPDPGDWLEKYLPPRPKLPHFSFNGNAVTNALFTKTDKFLQEVITYWNAVAQKAGKAELKKGEWMPVAVKVAIQRRIAAAEAARPA